DLLNDSELENLVENKKLDTVNKLALLLKSEKEKIERNKWSFKLVGLKYIAKLISRIKNLNKNFIINFLKKINELELEFFQYLVDLMKDGVEDADYIEYIYDILHAMDKHHIHDIVTFKKRKFIVGPNYDERHSLYISGAGIKKIKEVKDIDGLKELETLYLSKNKIMKIRY
ncbi:unnamed protein product, partial [marine sediment metagenome]